MDRKFDEKDFKEYLEDNKERLDKEFGEWVAKQEESKKNCSIFQIQRVTKKLYIFSRKSRQQGEYKDGM